MLAKLMILENWPIEIRNYPNTKLLQSPFEELGKHRESKSKHKQITM